MGVEPERLVSLGRVVVAAGRVEMVLALVANELCVANPAGTVSDVIKNVKKATRELPEPLSHLRPDVVEWVAQLPALFEVRHRTIHGVHLKSMDAAGRSAPVVWLTRKDEVRAVDNGELDAASEQLAVLHTEGMNLFGSLRMANLSLRSRAAET